MKHNIPIQWTKHLPPDQRGNFEKLLRTNVQLFNALRNLQHQELEAMERKEFSLKDFEDSNWAYKQAYRNGFRAALHDQLRLTDFIEG